MLTMKALIVKFFNLATQLSQLIFVVGHVALNMLIYAEKIEAIIKKKKTDNKSPSKNKTVDGKS